MKHGINKQERMKHAYMWHNVSGLRVLLCYDI